MPSAGWNQEHLTKWRGPATNGFSFAILEKRRASRRDILFRCMRSTREWGFDGLSVKNERLLPFSCLPKALARQTKSAKTPDPGRTDDTHFPRLADLPLWGYRHGGLNE